VGSIGKYSDTIPAALSASLSTLAASPRFECDLSYVILMPDPNVTQNSGLNGSCTALATHACKVQPSAVNTSLSCYLNEDPGSIDSVIAISYGLPPRGFNLSMITCCWSEVRFRGLFFALTQSSHSPWISDSRTCIQNSPATPATTRNGNSIIKMARLMVRQFRGVFTSARISLRNVFLYSPINPITTNAEVMFSARRYHEIDAMNDEFIYEHQKIFRALQDEREDWEKTLRFWAVTFTSFIGLLLAALVVAFLYRTIRKQWLA
jgi:hypothetical protein